MTPAVGTIALPPQNPYQARATWGPYSPTLTGVDIRRIRDGLGLSSVAFTERYMRRIVSTQDNPGLRIADIRTQSYATGAA